MYSNNENQNNKYNENDIYETAGYDFNAQRIVKNKTKKKSSGKTIALFLSCVLVGGIAGAFSTGYILSQKNIFEASSSYQNDTNFGYSTDYASTITNSSNMSINNIYETYKNAVVGVASKVILPDKYGQASKTLSSGTGFIISTDGYIITNNHVVEGASNVIVTLYDAQNYDAKIIGTDAKNDVALLKIEAKNLSTVKLGNSDNISVGETVIAIGNPLGELTYTVTSGIVSAENREVSESETSINMFQTDLAINPGNSGGPVFNLRGEVVGISTAKYSASSIEGIGFAIPINDAISVANQLKENGYVSGRPYMGVSVMNVDSSIVPDISAGAYVSAIKAGSSSDIAGIQQGDIITSLGNTIIKSTTDLMSALRKFKAGDTANITVNRSGQELNLSITFDEEKSNV